MRRRHALSTLSLASLAGLAPRPAPAQSTLEKIQVVGPVAESLTNLVYAIKNGMFRRAGLDVTLVETSSGAAATTAVITGTYDIGLTSLLPILAAHVRGIPIAIVAPAVINTARNPFAELQIAADAPYKTGADLNGKTMAVPSIGDMNTLGTKAWVDKTGGDWRSLKFVEVPNVAIEAAIVTRRVAGGIMQSPLLDTSVAAGTTKTLAYAYGAIAPVMMSVVYIARTDWAAQHAEALRTYNRVLNEATAYVNAHPAETAPYVAELTKIDLANTTKMHRTINGTTLDPAMFQPVIDAAAKYEQIAHGFPARELIWNDAK
jgi:NitT/TauT family transport system substrate-binding protein